MEWVLRSSQIHSTFGNLGFSHGDGYQIKENCKAALQTILHNILTEDKYLRTYRRSISFGQIIKKDFIPLLLHAKEDQLIELLIKIFVNLTIPIECLLSVDVISKTDFGRHTIFEINNLLSSIKAAFADNRATKVVIEFLKKNLDGDQHKLTDEQCTNVSNSLLLLRNILHIPEESSNASVGHNSPHTIQNQILWNIFSQSIDKVIIKLMAVPEAPNWAVTMVQLIALLYKDQHVVTLHKLLNMWLEASLSESSEDNESNTSPQDRGSGNSSPMLTSDPTSDSSDTGGSGKSNDDPNSVTNEWDDSSMNNNSENGNNGQLFPPSLQYAEMRVETAKGSDESGEAMNSCVDEAMTSNNNELRNDDIRMRNEHSSLKIDKKTVVSENSDCGYATQIENQGSISTSSNEDELPMKKPVHQKPHNSKQRINTNVRTGVSLQEKKRKKLVKRGKSNIINVQGLSHKSPTDDDISNILKEFTVDFLLKGYNHIVNTLHTQILTNLQLEIDISHFFWLLTYFLKFATQIELDLEHIRTVVSYDVISYLTAEGVNLCEQFELAIKLDGNDLKPSSRRLHLVVTAIREFVQAIEGYKKFPHICSDDQEALVALQVKMCETEELRSLLVLLLRHYNPKYHTKQYLQDLIVTNHILLTFLDSVMRLPDYKGSSNMIDHLKQFANPEMMHQYGLLLEDYNSNGEYVNDCIFTVMHHVGGDLDCLISLFQPNILKTFTSIWKSEFEICDDWSDLIEYVINTFIKKPHTLHSSATVLIDNGSFDEHMFQKPATPPLSMMPLKPPDPKTEDKGQENKKYKGNKDRWTEDDLSSLSWNYMQCNTSPDVVGDIIKLFKEDGVIKSRDSVGRELLKQKLIDENEFVSACKSESETNDKPSVPSKESRVDEIGKLCEQLISDGKSEFLSWVQQVLLDTCFAKICLEKKTADCPTVPYKRRFKPQTYGRLQATNVPVMSPVSYHSLIYNTSVPLVPWNCDQAAICKDLRFLQLLHKLGFQMPVDTGKVFIRIPHFWTANCIYEVANKVTRIDTSKLKFSLQEITTISSPNSKSAENYVLSPSPELAKDTTLLPSPDTLYQIHKQKNLAMLNYTPMPGSSFISNGDEVNKQNWLELVRKAQECKLTIPLKSSIIEEVKDITIETSQEVAVASKSALLAPLSVQKPYNVTNEIPAKHQESLPYSVHIPEPECNNSLCETASVASDLTRMYVSDEDEKTEVMVLQPLQLADQKHAHDPGHDSADSDNIAEKRPRVQ